MVMAALALVASTASAASAQGPASPAPQLGYANMVALDPLGIPLAIASIEYAGDAGGGIALGGNFSYTAPGSSHDARFTTAEAQGRFYPNERAFDGFSIGLTAGVTNYSNGVSTPNPAGGTTWDRQSVSLAALGVIVDYDWILGRSQRFLVGGGIGAKRLFGNTGRLKDLGGEVAYPTGRFVIGLLF